MNDVDNGNIDLKAIKNTKYKGNKSFANISQRWKKQKSPVMQIVAAQALAGTDYTQGMLNITHGTVFDTLILTSNYLGPLIIDQEKSIVNSQAYLRLLFTSWIYGRLSRDLNLIPISIITDNEREEEEEEEREKEDVKNKKIQKLWIEHSLKAWAMSQRFKPKCRLPHPIADSTHYIYRIQRWYYYLNMLLQVGNKDIIMDDPGLWGYGPTNKNITRDNIFPILNDKEEEK